MTLLRFLLLLIILFFLFKWWAAFSLFVPCWLLSDNKSTSIFFFFEKKWANRIRRRNTLLENTHKNEVKKEKDKWQPIINVPNGQNSISSSFFFRCVTEKRGDIRCFLLWEIVSRIRVYKRQPKNISGTSMTELFFSFSLKRNKK
jgi:small-conductance mechanosensitive channel